MLQKAGEEPGNEGLVRQLDFGFPFISLVRLKDAFVDKWHHHHHQWRKSNLSSIILHPMLPLIGIKTNRKARVFSKKLEGIYWWPVTLHLSKKLWDKGKYLHFMNELGLRMCNDVSLLLSHLILQRRNLHCKKRKVVWTRLWSPQLNLSASSTVHGNQRMCTQVQPTPILLSKAAAEDNQRNT